MTLKQHKILYSADLIAARVTALAEKIDADYKGRSLVAIGILQGSCIFYADLLRKLKTPVTCEFLGLSSYENPQTRSGEVKLLLDIEDPLEDKDLLIVEDLVNTGLTLRFLQKTLGARRPRSIKTCALLLKRGQSGAVPEVDYVGFELGDDFVIGYGIDHEGRHRELPYLATMA